MNDKATNLSRQSGNQQVMPSIGKNVFAVDEAKAEEYIRQKTSKAGGWGEALGGLIHKTGPFVLGLNDRITFGAILTLLLEIATLFAAAFAPIVGRKLSNLPSGAQKNSAWPLVVTNLDAIDIALGLIAIGAVLLPKLLRFLKAQKKAPQSSSYELSTAIRYVDFLKFTKTKVDRQKGALKHALSSLKIELHELIGDQNPSSIRDVVLLVFSENCKGMKATCRTASHKEINIERDAKSYMAYYVGVAGIELAEHDFSSKSNPFPKIRITTPVAGSNIDYKSVLFFPIFRSKGDKKSAENAKETCIGVVCVQSKKAYQFWRWGDHRKAQGGFARVAMERCLPQLVLIGRLLGEDAPGVNLNSQ